MGVAAAMGAAAVAIAGAGAGGAVAAMAAQAGEAEKTADVKAAPLVVQSAVAAARPRQPY